MESQGNSPAHNWEKDPPELAGAGSNLETAEDKPAPHPASDGVTFTDDPFSGHGRGQVNGIHENAFRFCLGGQGEPERRGDSGERTGQQLKGRRSFHMRKLGLLLAPSGKQCERKGT